MKSAGNRLTRRKLARIAAAGATALAAKAQSSKPAPVETNGLTRKVAAFIVNTRYESLPKDVIELGRKSILDGLGLALVGSVAKSGEITRSYLESLGVTRGNATVIGSALKSAARFAAFANGVGIHADDYDDTQLSAAPDRVYGLLTHPTAPCLSAVLAVAEARRLSGRDLLLAYHTGVEVECKISEAIAPRHYQDGFHSTGTCGTFASATAVMKLYGADAAACARALSVAASQAAGLRENFGTMTKPFHAGRAAESGIVAADLVQRGWTASDQILEAPAGFFHAAGGSYDANAITLGRPWTFSSPGISIKPFPSGSLTHPAMSELLRLVRMNQIKAEQVERLDVGTNRNVPTALIHHRPTDSLQGKFSMEFCMAALLLYGRAGLNEFTDEVVKRPEVQTMIQRVRFGVHPEAEKAGYDKMTSILDLHLKDGRTISGRADFAKGSPSDPMSFDEVASKFLDNCRYAKWPEAKANRVVESVRKLEDIPDVRAVTALLSA
ncbi:MAG: MmgE/PrpD family protein [Terriglobia bacterium]|nr:MAG: MmgE/PrpD family protein [Terriglobia bacterium]